MKLKEILFYFNPWWQEEISFPGISRHLYLNLLEKECNSHKITIITGLRQVGKTTLIKQLIYTLLEKINRNHILFVSLEHYGLKDFRIYDIIDEFRKIHKLHRKEKLYVFLDEISYKKDVFRDLKVIYDNENVKLFVSSSSAQALKDEKAFLTGRNKTIKIKPLSFAEYLEFKKIKVNLSEKYLLEAYFEDYMKYGGMPEYVLTSNPEIIVNLVSDIINKDIIAKHDIKDKQTINDLFVLLCERTGKQLTYNKIANILGVKADTIKKYISHFNENYLFEILPRHSKKINERLYTPKKLYIADVGIRNVYTGFKDLGAIYENLVFNKIKSQVKGYLYIDNTEIDFITKDTLIEAKYKQELSENQKKLFKTKKQFKKQIAQGVDFFME